MRRHEQLQSLVAAAKRLADVPRSTWLDYQRPSVAILQCIGSGPWAFDRRFATQTRALQALGCGDLTRLDSGVVAAVFPLDWQVKFTLAAITTLRECNQTFDRRGARGVCLREDLEVIFGLQPLPKVLAMYVRDYLNMPAFPIDRHVHEWLCAHELPHSECAILDLCFEAGINANSLNRNIFGSFSSNPIFPPSISNP